MMSSRRRTREAAPKIQCQIVCPEQTDLLPSVVYEPT